MLMHITRSMHLVEMMKFLLFIVTNLSSLALLCFQRYQNKKKRHGKTRSIEVFEVAKEDLQHKEMDNQGSISQDQKPQEMTQLQGKPRPHVVASSPTQAPRDNPTVGSFDTPCCRGFRYGIHPPPIKAKAYEIEASLVRLIQESRFLGTEVENPYDHLDYFERLCDATRIGGVPHESMKLILFPFSLGEKASRWERALPSHLVKSWDDCKEIFLNKFYPTQRTVQTRKDILGFKQGVHETFNEAWGRLKGYTRDCPHHGFKRGAILSTFYWGIDQEHKWTLNVASKGSFTNLTVDQGELLVENLAKSEDNYGDGYARATKPTIDLEEQRRSKEIKALNEKMDKLLNASQNMVQFVGKGKSIQGCDSKSTFQEGQDFDVIRMFQQLLKGQAKVNTKLESMSTKLQHLEEEQAKESSLTCKPMENLEGKINESQAEEHLIDENKESLLEIEEVLHGSQCKESMVASKEKVGGQVVVLMTIDEHEKDDEVKAPRVEHVGSFATMDVVSPPRASFEKMRSCGEKVFGYGNGEEVHALDGDSLESLFSTTMEKEKEGTKEEGTKTKKKKPNDHPPSLDPSSHTITLIPLRYHDGAIEYKVDCKGRSKPFAMVKALLTTELKDKGDTGLEEIMSKVLQVELKDPPWIVHRPLSPA